MSDDYCEMCDLPRSQCIHGMPKPSVEPAVKAAPTPRATRATKRVPGTAAKPAVTSRPVARRWTPPDELRDPILAVLREAGGSLSADDVFAALEPVVEDRLRPGDHELTPEGELRWHFAARRARQQLLGEGLMSNDVPGVWKLT